jgi:uncharacterized protein (TIGR03435 family)
MIAYNIGPPWLIDPPGRAGDVPRFDIMAKVPDDATWEQIPVMLRNLLADRFQVRVHHEQRQIVIYAVQVAKGGLKIKPALQGEQRQSGCGRNMFGTNGITTAVCQNMTPAR